MVRDKCVDCRKMYPRSELYAVVPPQYHGQSFWLCIPCWDHIIGAATLQAFR